MSDSADLEYIRQANEEFLNRLEQLAIEAIAYGNWSELHNYILLFQNGAFDDDEEALSDHSS